MAFSDKYRILLRQRLTFLCCHSMVVLGTDPCPKKTGARRLLWASLAYMDQFKPSLGYRLRSQLKNKSKNQLSCQSWQTGQEVKKRAWIGHLSWPLTSTTGTQTSSSHGFLLFHFASVALGVFTSGMACAFVSGQGHSSEWWAAVYCLPLAEGARPISIFVREAPATLELLYLHNPCLLPLLFELQPVMVLESPKKVFDLLSCFN